MCVGRKKGTRAGSRLEFFYASPGRRPLSKELSRYHQKWKEPTKKRIGIWSEIPDRRWRRAQQLALSLKATNTNKKKECGLRKMRCWKRERKRTTERWRKKSSAHKVVEGKEGTELFQAKKANTALSDVVQQQVYTINSPSRPESSPVFLVIVEDNWPKLPGMRATVTLAALMPGGKTIRNWLGIRVSWPILETDCGGILGIPGRGLLCRGIDFDPLIFWHLGTGVFSSYWVRIMKKRLWNEQRYTILNLGRQLGSGGSALVMGKLSRAVNLRFFWGRDCQEERSCFGEVGNEIYWRYWV